MFDLASVLDQAETIDLSLVYDRFALALRPQFPLATAIAPDILSTENKPEEGLAVLGEIPAGSPYYWSAQLRGAIDLDTLDRSDEAIAQLKEMAAREREADRSADRARRHPAQQETVRRSGRGL